MNKEEKFLPGSGLPENILKNIFNFSPSGIHIYELDENNKLIFKDFNFSANRILGINHTPLINKEITKAFPKLLGTNVLRKLEQTAISGSRLEKETVEYKDENVEGIFEVFAFQISKGKIAIFFNDITAIKKAEQIENEERFRSLVNSMLEPAIVINLRGIINFVNRRALKFLGLNSSTDIFGKNVLKFLHPDFHPAVVKLLKGTSGITGPVFEELKIISYGNEFRWIEIFGSKITFDTETAVLVTFRDITARKEADERITLLTNALHSAANGVVITNIDGKIIWVNSAVSKLVGYSQNELLGQNPRILKSGIMKKSFYQNMWDKILSGKVWHGELTNKRKDGSFYIEEMTITPVVSGEKGITHFIAIKQDVTKRIAAEKELREAKEKAEETNKLKSSFLANMSHELRTPLVGILGFSEMLIDELKDEDHNDMAEKIYASGERLMETLNSILDLSRIEANKLEMTKINCNIGQIIEQQVALFEGFATKKKVFLKYNRPTENIYAYLDEQILRQILNNLINNAIKYTPKGGVTVNCLIESDNKTRYIKIIIEDTGIGISGENLEMIFEEFRQASEGFNRQFEGTGLGLTLTKKFVDLLNGTIKVESKVNRGSKFTLMFPENILASSIVSEKETMPEFFIDTDINGEKDLPRVLLVENDLYSSDVTKMFLKKICRIENAASGEEAIKMAEENDYAVILMDINLGTGISGIETTKILRSMKKYRQKPIIALTAFAMQGDKEEFIQSGCNDYLSKPFTKNGLQDVVNKFL